MSASPNRLPNACCILAFDPRNRLALSESEGRLECPFFGADLAQARVRLEDEFPQHTPVVEMFTLPTGETSVRVFLSQVHPLRPDDASRAVRFHSLESLEQSPSRPSAAFSEILAGLGPYLAEVPYLELGGSEFIHPFRPPEERNLEVYAQDRAAQALYQSRLCAAIKELARQRERAAGPPVPLDFGAVRYLIPSHFGFCLGVKNAIERAYETLAENPGKRVFMLSELIHNPFVNEDLRRRGLRYLQTDRGIPYTVDGRTATEDPKAPRWWDALGADDLVIIPAFGATDEDKARLVRKGLPLRPYDATCMLVEKVWRAARQYGREGRTVIVHGKPEHEETKATFSHTRRYAPALIVRDLAEARELGEIVAAGDTATARERFTSRFAGRHTPGFDVDRDLTRVAVVNQTTLLRNETLAIIAHLRDVYRSRFGEDDRVGGGGSRDTLCYATQVNQDALAQALEAPVDRALVIGGRNSSNTYQLYRLCEQRLGARALFISSEEDIRESGRITHYHYAPGGHGSTEIRSLWDDAGRPPRRTNPARILITGGASCPDGIIQQVIDRINRLVPPSELRSIDEVLSDVRRDGSRVGGG